MKASPQIFSLAEIFGQGHDRPLARRLWLGFLLIAVLPLFGLSWFYLNSFEKALTGSVLQTVSTIADKKSDEIASFIDERLAAARLSSQRQFLPFATAAFAAAAKRGDAKARQDALALYSGNLEGLVEVSAHSQYHDVLLISADGTIVYSLSNGSIIGSRLAESAAGNPLAEGFANASQRLQIEMTPLVAKDPYGTQLPTFVVAPLLVDGELKGALAFELNTDPFINVLMDRTGLGESGEIVLGRREGEDIVFTAPHLLRGWSYAKPDRHRVADTPEALRRASLGEHGRGITSDYAGKPVAAAWRYVPALAWGMAVKIDAEEAFAPIRRIRRQALLALGIIIGASTIFAYILGRRLVLAEKRLRQSHRQIVNAQRIAQLGSWSHHYRRNQLEWSEEVFHILEFNQETTRPSRAALYSRIHPEDRGRARAAIEESLRRGTQYSCNYRLEMPDGRIKHVRGYGETILGSDEQPRVAMGTIQDVTLEKRAADALELYASIFEHSGEDIVVTDHENRIVAVNPAFVRHTGYALDDVRGKNPRVLASGLTPREVYPVMWKSLNEKGFWQGELSDRRKDGTVYPKWTSISVIRDSSGNVTHHIASFNDISERKAAEERIHHLAHHDTLTGLLNRFSLESRLEQALFSARREGGKLAVMFLDLDRFKLINDSLGHTIGDRLLVTVSRRLEACVRESDIIARPGGDEFVVVITGIDDGMAAATVAEKIVDAISQDYIIDGQVLHTSPSVGIAVFPNDGQSVDELMKNADTAMYEVKRRGRGNYRFFTAAMTEAADERLKIERGLRVALSEQQLELHYQPQLCTHSDRVCGVEALVRWRDPERGLIPPLKFIPIAEETGLINQIGDWVLEEACRQLAAWREAGISGVRMAVNLSAHQLRDPELIGRVSALIEQYAIATDELELEVTESVAMENPERAIRQLEALRGIGVELAIDDFGTGYSSLAYLKLLPIQALKLDRTFVRDIETDENDATISAATIGLAHSLGLKVVAEGVESQAQREFLESEGCDILQGYLFSKPLPASEATAFLQERGDFCALRDQATAPAGEAE